jgi:protein involved in polysaccharide export with SLBB domain
VLKLSIRTYVIANKLNFLKGSGLHSSLTKLMSRYRFFFCQRLSALLIALTIGMGACLDAAGQYSFPTDRTTALDVPESQAERAAEQLVSLSAEKIISLLQNETGLMLQVKRLLVRKAFEQGRLLDPEDLTDDALFTLIRQDYKVRVLATREIEQRYYVRARPTRQELDRDRLLYGELGPPITSTTQATQAAQRNRVPTDALNLANPPSQEELYWAANADDVYHPVVPNYQPPSSPGQPSTPSSPPSAVPGSSQSPFSSPQTSPQNLPANDPRRQFLTTQLQPWSADYLDGRAVDTSALSRIRPEDIPQLLNASGSMTSGSLFGGGSGMGFRSGTGSGSGFGAIGTSPFASFSGSSGLSGFSGSPFSGSGLSGSGLSTNLPSNLLQQNPASLQQQAGLSNQLQTQTQPPFTVPEYPTQPILSRRPNPYADVPSLYDLYSQYSRRSPVLERFGQDIFQTGTGNFDELPMDMPVGPDYVVGPGDGLKIELWGGVSDRLMRLVDPEGSVSLPEAGTVQVSGRTLGEVQHLVQTALRSQYRDVEADVSIARLRSVRVYVVGDVQRPGAYDVSSLSTPLNAVFQAGGPTSQGSLRILRHHRGKQLIEQVDVYDLLLHGVRSGIQHLQSGDTVLVPPLGPEVTIQGMVRRPAVYELNGEKTLAEVLQLAGGVLPSGTLRHMDVERVESHQNRTMLRLDIPENNNEQSVNKALQDFLIQDGDQIKISPILPYADKTVYVDGHVFRPGKYAYRDGMTLRDLIKSYNDLLPEPYKRHAEIIRLQPPDYTPVVLAFNLEDALSGKDQNLALKPFDTVRVFSRYDFEDPPVITISGEVRDPGDHVTNGATYLRDAVYLAGGTTPDALLDDAQVFRRTENGKLKVVSVNLARALSGDAKDNILLESKDRVVIHRNLAKVDPPTVKIEGEVARPGKYPLGQDMTAADLVRVAGGFRRSAYTEEADLTRYTVQSGQQIVGEHVPVHISQALAGEADTDLRLWDGDVLTIRQLTGWQDVGATITVSGEVVHAGTYGIREGERLSSIIARAGGFRAEGYAFGTVFQRVQVKELEEKNRAQLVRQTQDQGPALKSMLTPTADDKMAQEAALLQWQATLEKLQDTPPSGRLVIHISNDVKRWANTSADIQVRAGDSVFIPKRPNIVTVDGSVYNPTAVAYKPGKSAGWYLRQAGGPTNFASTKAVFVIRADGSVVGGSGGLFSGGVESVSLQPGDMVLVPEKGFSTNARWRTVLQAAQIAYYVGISTQVATRF